MSCPHIVTANLQPPRPSQQVYREECTQCFDTQDHAEGIVVCLECFNGGCIASSERKHARRHADKTGHLLGVRIKRTRIEAKRRDSQEPPMKKLAIHAPNEEELYSSETEIRCFGCDGSNGGKAIETEDAKIASVVQGILKSYTSAQQAEVKAWEEEIAACEHTLMLQQEPVIEHGKLPTQCSSCDLTANLWLCLTCGLANCGRQQFGGIGGNGHALQHFKDTGHAVGVKLGTITPEGTADIYCYSCDDAKIDPELPTHLRNFGIEVLGQTKTEKSSTELQLEHNLKFDFNMTGDDGKELEPVFGPGLTGLKNLGNSCYMASVLQTLFALPAFRERYSFKDYQTHVQTCNSTAPATCIECQMLKMSDGLLSGRYSHPATAPPAPSSSLEADSPDAPKFQEGIKPSHFKSLIGKGHAEFATMRQQDSEEFIQHLLSKLRQDSQASGSSKAATDIFKFGFEQRLQCPGCARVGYKVDPADLASVPVGAKEVGKDENGKTLYERVELEQCVEALCAPETIDYACGHCDKNVEAIKTNSFKTFPDVLVVHMKKFQLVNWMPTKLEIPVEVPENLTLDRFAGKGLQDGELELDQGAPASSALPDFNVAAMSQLEAMGFPTIRCQRALLATGNADAELAMGWLFEHMEDADIDEPIQSAGGKTAGPEPSADQIAMLADMGFTAPQAKKALRETDGNPERAVEWLFSHPDDDGSEAPAVAVQSSESSSSSIGGTDALPAAYRLRAFISHKGPSVHSGHYVATIRQGETDDWILFNDEKVVRAEEGGGAQMRELAYLYVYERV